MSSDRWETIQELYHAALELHPAQRSAFLEEACGDDEAVRQEVKALLAEHEKAGGFLETPALGLAAQAQAAETPSGSLVGKTLGAYQILSLLGSGGMGEVYKARDTKLNRSVAIKVLPPDKTSDADRKRRFVQEARAASALNHPNIITVHDIGSEGGIDFVVMENVEGKTLDRLIPRRGLKLNEALKYSIQIADGLAKAHAAGIVHRDLKPGNLMVTEDGLVKVLDFGLAKLTERQKVTEESATGKRGETEPGMVLGTVSYMSPEQAEGKGVDARSDIFSFGSLLYEMVTGQCAFHGDSTASTLAAILTKDPKPAREISRSVPQELEKIIGRCLRKDRERRFQHLDDVKVALQELKEESDPTALAGTRRPVTPDKHYWFSKRPQLFTAGLVLSLLVALLCWWFLGRSKTPHEPGLTRVTSDSGLTTDAVISPDGKLIAFASDRGGNNLDIWVKQVSGGDPIRVTQDPADDHQPAFSPDGRQIVFRSEKEGGGIYIVSALGGEARLLAQKGRNPRFSPAGDWIAYWAGPMGGHPLNPQAGRMFLIPPTREAPKPIDPPGILSAACPIWSPDGTRLLFYGSDSTNLPLGSLTSDFWVWPLAGGNPVKTGAFAAFAGQSISVTLPSLVPAPGEWINDQVFFSAKTGDSVNLWQVSISPKNWSITGPAHRLTKGSGLEVRPSLAKTGLLVFSSLTENADIFSLPIDASLSRPKGPLEQLTRDLAADYLTSMSADGKKLVFVSRRSGNADIWIKDLESGKESPLTESPAEETGAQISPDGSLVSYSIRTPGTESLPNDIYLLPTKGGLLQKLCDGCGGPLGWSTDNKLLLIQNGTKSRENQLKFGIGVIDLATGKADDYLQSSEFWLFLADLTHDGRWTTFVAFNTRDFPLFRPQVLAAAFQLDTLSKESEWIRIVSDEHWNDKPRWSPDGNRIYFVSDRDGFACLWTQPVEPETKWPLGPPLPLYHIHQVRRSILNVGYSPMAIAVAPDKIVFNLGEMTGNIWMTQLPEN